MINYLNYVNPKIGTNNTKRFSEGNILPIVGRPNQLASFTIQTHRKNGFDKRWFYNPYYKSFEGIRLTHQPSPWVGDYGYLLIMPSDFKDISMNSDLWYSSYNPEKTILKPHYMEGKLFKDNINFKMTPTNSGAILKFKFSTDNKHEILLIGQEGTLEFFYDEKSKCILGRTNSIDHEINFDLWSYFVIDINTSYDLIKKDKNLYGIVFKENDVTMKISTSFIDYDQAFINFNRELKNYTFDEIKKETILLWEEKLSKIEITINETSLSEMFYTSLYRMYLFPRKFHEYDINLNPTYRDLEKGNIKYGKMYVDNGFWDTYKTVYPLYSIIDKKLYKDILEGIKNFFNDNKLLPKWLSPNELGYMPGTLVNAVIADAIIKDILPKDEAAEFLDIMIQANENVEKTHLFEKYGYFPHDLIKESVNETLDASYVNYCIYSVAKHLNIIVDQKYYKNSFNYKNIFDKETGFMRPKDQHGRFLKDFNPITWGGAYTEGSAWQNSFNVYHDITGLDKLYNNKLTKKIDELFEHEPIFDIGSYGHVIHEMSEMAIKDFGQCAISNQPSFHIPYIYSKLGDVNKTYEKVKMIIKGAFLNKKYPGDEDNGSMAGWFVFSVLGFYPLSPGKPEYIMSFPFVKSATINLENNKKILIDDNLNINELKNKINHYDIIKGGHIKKIITKNKGEK